MRSKTFLTLLIMIAGTSVAAAPKDNDRPDKEMLQMMELLKEIDMIKQIDLMQDMQKVESAGQTTLQKSPAVKKREAAK